MTIPASISDWLTAGAGAGVGLGATGTVVWAVMKFLDWLGGRVDNREKAVERARESVDAGTQALFDNLQSQINQLTKRVTHAEAELAECRERDARGQAEIGRLLGVLQGRGEAADRAQAALAQDRMTDRLADRLTHKITGG